MTENRDHSKDCVVCGRATLTDYAVVVGGERLCLIECFGWFSGYPWVLFEIGMLVSDLRAWSTHEEILDPSGWA